MRAALVTLALALAAPAAAALPPPPPWPAAFVTVAQVPADLGGAGAPIVILDARDRGAFHLGHIPGAQRIDWRDFRAGILTDGRLPDDLARVAADLALLGVDDHRRVLVCGASAAGWGEEGRVAWMIRYLGHPAVAVLDGGCDAWSRAGRPRSTSTSSPTAGRFTPRIDAPLRARKADVVQATRGGTTQLLDARTTAEYLGATPYFEARGGHIPGAKHLDFKSLFDARGDILSSDLVRERVVRAGLALDRPIIVYCTGGVRSALAVLVLRSAGLDARNYDGSYWEWAKDERLPVERPAQTR